MNTVILIGKVKEVHIVNDNWTTVELDVKRDFKNVNGEYETDTFTINFYNGIGQLINQLELKDKVISVNARLENKGSILTIIGHKITTF